METVQHRSRGQQLSAREAAALAGMSLANWHGWRARGVPRSNPVPAPDGKIGNSQWWWEATVRAWIERRTGSPVGARGES